MLIEAGAKLSKAVEFRFAGNVRNFEYEEGLYLAIQFHKMVSLEYILSNYKDPTITPCRVEGFDGDYSAISPIQMAVQLNSESAAKLLIREKATLRIHDACATAAKLGHNKILFLLMEQTKCVIFFHEQTRDERKHASVLKIRL